MANPNPDYRLRARLIDKAGDWGYAQAQYELGIQPLVEIAKDIGVPVSTLSNRANKEKWIRDPVAKAKVVAARNEVLASTERVRVDLARDKVIKVTAVMQSRILVSHREDIKQARRIATKLLSELEAVSSDTETFTHLGELLNAPDERGVDRLNRAYRKVISLPERSATLNALGAALKTVIMLERQAYGITGMLEDPEATRPPEEVTKGLSEIMSKFDQVLALQAPAPEPQARATEVIDVPSTDKAAVT